MYVWWHFPGFQEFHYFNISILQYFSTYLWWHFQQFKDTDCRLTCAHTQLDCCRSLPERMFVKSFEWLSCSVSTIQLSPWKNVLEILWLFGFNSLTIVKSSLGPESGWLAGGKFKRIRLVSPSDRRWWRRRRSRRRRWWRRERWWGRRWRQMKLMGDWGEEGRRRPKEAILKFYSSWHLRATAVCTGLIIRACSAARHLVWNMEIKKKVIKKSFKIRQRLTFDQKQTCGKMWGRLAFSEGARGSVLEPDKWPCYSIDVFCMLTLKSWLGAWTW